MLRVRRAHWVLCQAPRPLVILENRNLRRTKPRNNKTPRIPREHRHLHGVCQIRTASLSTTAVPTPTDIINSRNQSLYRSSLFLTSMHNMGDTHTSRKHGVSPRDQITYNQRVSGTILKSRILKLDQTRLSAGRGVFNLGCFAIGRNLSYQH